jgi:protoporphyrin/coproporphyrin ferrochelatase
VSKKVAPPSQKEAPSSGQKAVLLLAHGTPDALDEIPEYLKNVTGGRSLPKRAIEEIQHRYSLIGASPLTKLTMEQAQLLSQQLNLSVYVGMRNWKPYIADVVRTMRADGVTKFVTLCLAPQNSRTSVGLYRQAVFAKAGNMRVDFIEGWADHPMLVDAFAERLRAVWTPGTPVLFTAHSVPCRTIQTTADATADPYAIEAKRTAAKVAERVGLAPEEWFFAFQSQGQSSGPGNSWIGPTVEDTLTALRQQDVERLIVQPVGFLCDHVEILYDVDIAFRQFAAYLGMELLRPESLNDSRLLTEALADLARQGLARLD